MARASDSTAKATCTMRMCELAVSRQSWHQSSPSSWTRMEVDDGQRDEQDESSDKSEELRRVLAARQPTELESRNILKQIMLFSHLGARCV